MNRSFLFSWALIAGTLVSCGSDELPSREQIPVLRERLFSLQRGVSAHNHAAVDSLLSIDILDVHQSSDSLFSFIYGPSGDFAFRQFGEYTIFFSNELAIIDCFVMDSTENRGRPLRLIYKLDDGVWLLKEFRAGDADSKTLL